MEVFDRSLTHIPIEMHTKYLSNFHIKYISNSDQFVSSGTSPRNIIIKSTQPFLKNSWTKEAIARKRKGCVTYILMFRGLLSNYCVAIPYLKLMMVTSADRCLHETKKNYFGFLPASEALRVYFLLCCCSSSCCCCSCSCC
jgi:hypothetical protein